MPRKFSLAKKNLTPMQKMGLCLKIASKINRDTGNFPEGLNSELSYFYGVSVSTVNRIWQQYKQDYANNAAADENFFRPNKILKSTHHTSFDDTVAIAIDNILKDHDGFLTFRDIKVELEQHDLIFSLSTVFRFCNGMGMVTEKSYIKPQLNDRHKINRIDYVLNQIDISDPENLTYFDQTNRVHLDEKWFYLKPCSKHSKLLPDHESALFCTQHKSHIPKVMVSCAICEPSERFDGKAGIQVHADLVPAARTSSLRPAGTIILRPKSLDADEFFDAQVKVDSDIGKTGQY
jgi:hypothetical protein